MTGEESAENCCFLETLYHVEEVTKLLRIKQLNKTRGLAEGKERYEIVFRRNKAVGAVKLQQL